MATMSWIEHVLAAGPLAHARRGLCVVVGGIDPCAGDREQNACAGRARDHNTLRHVVPLACSNPSLGLQPATAAIVDDQSRYFKLGLHRISAKSRGMRISIRTVALRP